jgi:hypothetical protein
MFDASKHNGSALLATSGAGTKENSSLAYIVAAITFGAALGNMFLAGKIRNVMKVKVRNPMEEHYVPPKNNNFHEPPHRPPPDFRAHIPKVNVIPDHIVMHLNNLQLPLKMVSESEVKDAYRKAVMQYHPDRLDKKDVSMKAFNEVKFKQSADAYQELLKYIKDKA